MLAHRSPGSDIPHGSLLRWPHTDFGAGIPYYDEELDLMHSKAHMRAVAFLVGILQFIEKALGLTLLSDNPIWYLEPGTNIQKPFAGDIVLARTDDATRVTAEDLLFVLEIVSTNDRRKEKKDTIFQKALNEYNAVPEFVLYFPEPDDERVLRYFRMDPVQNIYSEIRPDAKGLFTSQTVPGLALRSLPEAEWTPGRKIEVLFEGRRLALNVSLA